MSAELQRLRDQLANNEELLAQEKRRAEEELGEERRRAEEERRRAEEELGEERRRAEEELNEAKRKAGALAQEIALLRGRLSNDNVAPSTVILTRPTVLN